MSKHFTNLLEDETFSGHRIDQGRAALGLDDGFHTIRRDRQSRADRDATFAEAVAAADRLAAGIVGGADPACQDRVKRGAIEAVAAKMIASAFAPVGTLRLIPGSAYFADIRPPSDRGVLAAIDAANAALSRMVAVFAASEPGKPYAEEFEAFIAPNAFTGNGPAPKSAAARQALRAIAELRGDAEKGVFAKDLATFNTFLLADQAEKDKAKTGKSRRRRRRRAA